MNNHPIPAGMALGNVIRPERCEKCKWAQQIPHPQGSSVPGKVYACRGAPPAVVVVPAQGIETVVIDPRNQKRSQGMSIQCQVNYQFPIVGDHDWCGSWKPRLDA